MQDRAAQAEGLMAAMASGDRQALAQLITLYGAGLQRYMAQMLPEASEAEDMAQEVFLRAWRNAGRYDASKAAVSTWLYRIATNLCIDRARRRGLRRFLGLETAPEEAADAPGPEQVLEGRERLAATRAALARLPVRQRQALLLRAAGELSTGEIAATLGISPGAAEQLLVRGRAALRKLLETEDD
ncbi:sigma-70 family RNA polymerase sigma factor [Oceanicola sp. D3]|uniref:RNA polymerase sigma factor n=1 Tax=Oceanicola sp. D3 TaxID=2587163 RepID=UPI0011245F9F|nr:sigma-70 family RNA polymerase sigma factor [Oceanicola sp. D3]QDC09283.1 sigma-70 family RNA polymerase sigma factor [Oceanicola sp. D3]